MTSAAIEHLSSAVIKCRYVILVAWLGISIGCYFPASDVNKFTTQDTTLPPDSRAALARQFYRTYFPSQADATGFVLLSTVMDPTIDLGSDIRYNGFDAALDFWSKSGNMTFDRQNVPVWPAADPTPTGVGSYSSYRSVVNASLPLAVAEQYMAPGNRSAFITISFVHEYDDTRTVAFDENLQQAIKDFSAIYGLDGLVESTVFSLPTFLASITASSAGDTEVLFFVVFPISLGVFGFSLCSGRLLLIPLLTLVASYCLSFAILTGIAKSTPINSMGPSVCVFVLLTFVSTYTYFFASQYRKLLKINKLSASVPEYVIPKLYTSSGRATFLACTIVTMSGISLASFDTELIRSVGIGIIVVIVCMMLVTLTLPPALIASFPCFFAGCVDVWIHVKPIDIADPTGTDELGRPMNLEIPCEDDASPNEQSKGTEAKDEQSSTRPEAPTPQRVQSHEHHIANQRDDPIHERWHLRVVYFVAQFPYCFFIALVCIGACIGPMCFAFNGHISNNLEEYMPQSHLLDRWQTMKQVFRAGEVFSYNLFMKANKKSSINQQVLDSTQGIVYDMISALPRTNVRNFDSISIDGVESSVLPNDGNISMANLTYCFGHMKEPFCAYRLLISYIFFNSTAGVSYALIRLDFDPTSRTGVEWYEKALVLLPTLEKKYNYTLHLYGYGADSYATVQDAENALGKLVWVTVLIVFGCVALAFGSLVIPVKACFSTFLSVSVAYGVGNLVYDDETTGRAMAWQVPIVCLTICSGLALNFELVVLMKIFDQRWHGVDSKVAVVRGVAGLGRDVTVAALISMINFAGLMANSIPAIRQIGLLLFVTTAVQAYVIRLFLTPALMSFCGEHNWWPLNYFSSSVTPLVVEEPADGANPTLIDAEDYRRSAFRIPENYRHSYAPQTVSQFELRDEQTPEPKRSKSYGGTENARLVPKSLELR